MGPRALGVLVALLAVALPSTALGVQSASLRASLTPERLGQSTTLGFSFQITAPGGRVPPPLTGVEVSYPVNLGFALSELGLATCSPGALELFGLSGCPANSLMGSGTAIVEIPFGPELIRESANVEIIRTTNQSGHIALLIYATGHTPVNAELVLPGIILPAPPPFGGRLTMTVPLLPTLPEAPNGTVVQFHATLGPLRLKYYEHVHGKIVEFQPRGIPLPDTCPRGGFPFTASFAFLDGSNASARTTVACPHIVGKPTAAVR
jgi:hypothetical protein